MRHWTIAGSLEALYADPQKRKQLKQEACWEVENGLKLTASEGFFTPVTRSDWYRAISKLFERFDYLLLPGAQAFLFDKMSLSRPPLKASLWTHITVGWKS